MGRVPQEIGGGGPLGKEDWSAQRTLGKGWGKQGEKSKALTREAGHSRGERARGPRKGLWVAAPLPVKATHSPTHSPRGALLGLTLVSGLAAALHKQKSHSGFHFGGARVRQLLWSAQRAQTRPFLATRAASARDQNWGWMRPESLRLSHCACAIRLKRNPHRSPGHCARAKAIGLLRCLSFRSPEAVLRVRYRT